MTITPGHTVTSLCTSALCPQIARCRQPDLPRSERSKRASYRRECIARSGRTRREQGTFALGSTPWRPRSLGRRLGVPWLVGPFTGHLEPTDLGRRTSGRTPTPEARCRDYAAAFRLSPDGRPRGQRMTWALPDHVLAKGESAGPAEPRPPRTFIVPPLGNSAEERHLQVPRGSSFYEGHNGQADRSTPHAHTDQCRLCGIQSLARHDPDSRIRSRREDASGPVLSRAGCCRGVRIPPP
jgi:hypothetical protein